MLFVAIANARPGTAGERASRRLAWKPPEDGPEVVAEYWLQPLKPNVIVVFKAENIGQIWAATLPWDDLGDFTVYPAISAEEGLELLKQMHAG